MKKSSIKAFLSFILCFLFTFTSSCSNLSAVFGNNTTTPVISNNVSNSSLDNDFKKLLNSEYKKFSIKAGEPAGTSITLSKRYVLSTKTVQTYLPTDYDSAGQPPNRIKITVITNKTDATGGVNFTIDGVTSFNVPAPATAGNYAIGTSVITVTDPDSSHKQFEFLWDGRYTTGNLVEDGIYTVHALKNGTPTQTKTLYLDTEIEVTSDPLIAAGLEFYTPQQFTDLSNLVGQIKAPEDLSNALYDVVNELEILQNKLTSLQIRVPQDPVKIAEVQQQITDATNKKTTIESNLTSSINDLVIKKNSLRSFVNTITKNSAFSQDYLVTEKPKNSSKYREFIFTSDEDFFGWFDDSASFYGSDDPNNTNLVSKFQKDNNIVEKIDSYLPLDCSNILSTEIQLSKDLFTEYLSGNFLSSGINNKNENLDVLYSLKSLISYIENHSKLLIPKSKKVASDLDRKYKALLKDTADLHYSVQIPIALAMQEEPSMQNHPYIIEALKPLPNNFTIKNYMDWVKNFKGLIDTFNALDPLSPVKERVIRYTLHFDQGQWDALPQADKTELIKTFSDVVGVIVPTTPSEVVQNLIAGQVFKIVGKVAKSTIGLLKKKITTPAGVISELDNIGKLVHKEEKQVAKNSSYISIICKLNRPGLKTLSNNGAECEPNPADIVKELTYAQSSFKENYVKYGGKTPKSNITVDKTANIYMKDFSKIDKNSLTQEEKNIHNSISIMLADIDAQNGIPIKKYSVGGQEFYSPDLSTRKYNLAEVKFSSGGHIMDGRTNVDDPTGILLAINQMQTNGFMPTTLNNSQAITYVENLQKKFGLIWHHVEDADTYQLVPGMIHYSARHSGARSIIKKLKLKNISPSQWKSTLGNPI